jgi:hypothetical protein
LYEINKKIIDNEILYNLYNLYYFTLYRSNFNGLEIIENKINENLKEIGYLFLQKKELKNKK